MHSTLLRTGGVDIPLLPGRPPSLAWLTSRGPPWKKEGVCVASHLAGVILKGEGLANSNFRIITTVFPVTLRGESGAIHQDLGFQVFVIVIFASNITE